MFNSKLISDEDRHFIENKYHLTDKPFDGFNRMAYHGYDYDPATGMSDEELDAGLAKLAEQVKPYPHAVAKAKLFAYVLDHTRIDCNEHDWFPGFYTTTRAINKYTQQVWQAEAVESFPKELERIHLSEASGCGYGWLDFDHTVPDWDALMKLGFPGILKRAESAREAISKSGCVGVLQEALYEGIRIEYEAIIRLLYRLGDYAAAQPGERSKAVSRSMYSLATGAPKSTLDALEMIFLYFLISETVESYQVRSLGYGLDATLYPFYHWDTHYSDTTDAQVEEWLAYFLMQWSAIGNYWGQPFYLGGTGLDGKTKVNELSYMILDVYDRLGIYNPKIQIKVSEATPKEFVCKALDMIRGGSSSIVFCSERHITQSLMAYGATYEEAVDSVISGCYEYKIKNKGIGMACMYPNLTKPVSLALDNGFDTVSGQQVGPYTGEAEEFTSFAQVYKAFKTQLDYMLREDINALDRLCLRIGEINPSIMFSATMTDCVNELRDALDGGLDNSFDITAGGIGSATDALMGIYELVFERKETTIGELRAALDANWVGYERLRRLALKCRHKYGNGDPLADSYAREIMRHICVEIAAPYRNSHNGITRVEGHSARAFIINGAKTKATPDGRFSGTELSKNLSPVPGAERKGVTALIKSATTLDNALMTTGACLDVMLHPSAVQGSDGLEAMYKLLMTYVDRGGASMHFNVFDSELLRDAQAHPEKYTGLQVRVCGWNALWNDMPKSEQDAYILRAEANK